MVILDLDASAQHEHVGIRLRHLLATFEPTLIMGAHDGLSARVAADAGFRALWASGLCMSTALGLRDNDEASWTDRLTLVAHMVEAANLPVLVDGDSGYGNFNTARRFALQAERTGAAGICIEDKKFPKTNSFVGDRHELAPVGEFCGKIRACRDAVRDSAFVVVANQAHDSTGGQRSLSPQVNFPALAVACGYRRVYRCTTQDSFAAALKSSLAEPGPSFVYLRIRPGSASNLGRPDVHPSYVARRFRAFLGSADCHGASPR